MTLIELLQSANYWHWLAFGLILLALELLGTAGYFLWLGISALIVGVLMTLLDMSWQLQWSAFVVFSLVTTWLWWRKQLRSDKQSDAGRSLNQKQKQLIGTKIHLDNDISIGDNRINLGDTTWTARSNVNIKAGAMVEVTDVDGIILIIAPLE